MIINGQHIRNALIQTFLWLRNKWVYHSIFWLVFFISLLFLEDQQQPLPFRILIELINVFFYSVLVYFNILYLIPNFLTGKRLWIYLLMFVASCMVMTPLKVFLLYLLHSNFPEFQAVLIENQRWYFSTLLLMGGSSTVYSIITEWKNQEKEQAELQSKTIESELRFLKTQINPHFLFNTLNSLYALTLKKSDAAPDVVLMLSEMMRYMLYECNEPEVLLSKEINYIENYLNLEKLRLTKNFDVTFESKGEPAHKTIAPLLFIPFIENTFKHGASHQIKNSFIHIYLEVQGNSVIFTCENSKPEFLPTLQPQRKSGGIGLANVRRRLDLLYPKKNRLDIEDSPEKYKVTLEVTLN
jgi:two-component system, LytTR family, sensor kinase